MEIRNKKDDPFGPQFIINDEIVISRNHYKNRYYTLDGIADEPTPYYLTDTGQSGDNFSIALTEEQMLEMVAAFMLVYEGYDHPDERTGPWK